MSRVGASTSGWLVVALLLLPVAGCRKPDPAAERLAQRRGYQVELTGWSWSEGPEAGKALLNLRVMQLTTAPLNRLTLRIEEVDGDGNTAATRLETVAVGGLSYEQPQDLILRLEQVSAAVDSGGFIVYVEEYPPESDWPQYPELKEFAATPAG